MPAAPNVLWPETCSGDAEVARYGRKRLAVISPYQPIGNKHVVGFLQEAGYEVIKVESFLSPSMRNIAAVDTARMIGALKDLAALSPDAILQAGTNLAMIDLAAEAERWLGLPVIAINAATYWHALRSNGIHDRIHGYGRLLEEF